MSVNTLTIAISSVEVANQIDVSLLKLTWVDLDKKALWYLYTILYYIMSHRELLGLHTACTRDRTNP